MSSPAPSSSLLTGSRSFWAGVEHRHLASLAAVARTRSFRGAARALGYSQSALSQQISQLERLVGVTVANRRRGSSEVTLTPAGEAVLRRAQPILAVHHAAQADMKAFAEGGGRLRVGAAEHLGTGMLGATLAAFLQRNPGAQVEVVYLVDGAELLDELAHGRLDVVLGDPPREADPALATELLTPEELVVLAPPSWSVVRRADASIAELLSNLPVAVDATDPDTARALDDLRAGGVTLSAVTRVGGEGAGASASASAGPGAAALRSLVAAGSTAALVPAGAVEPGDPTVVALPLVGLVGPRAVGVTWQARRLHAPLTSAFVDAAIRHRGRADSSRRGAATVPLAAVPMAAAALAARWEARGAEG